MADVGLTNILTRLSLRHIALRAPDSHAAEDGSDERCDRPHNRKRRAKQRPRGRDAVHAGLRRGDKK